MGNLDPVTVEGFGEEWAAFDQEDVSEVETKRRFDAYFAPFRWDLINNKSIGFDLGCGTGRWTRLLLPRVGHIHCIDPSEKALNVARRNLSGFTNVSFHAGDAENSPIPDGTMDFGFSLGVLHHIPDTAAAIKSATGMLKPGAPFLVYLYYRFDNRPAWFRAIWHLTDPVRRLICRLPFKIKKAVTEVIALVVYLPLARLSKLVETLGLNPSLIPLSHYRNTSFYSMRTDALDRFGTRLEQRFTRQEITNMLQQAGCEQIQFSDNEPYWCTCAVKR